MDAVITSELFSPSDIRWIKNVTNYTHGNAYMDSPEEFVLHFPDKIGKSKNLLSPKVGEIMVLFQTINGVRCFTHLVTPVDYVRDDKEERDGYQYGRNVEWVAMVGLDSVIPVSATRWAEVEFGGISNGNAVSIENIKSAKGDLEMLRLDVWNRFSNFFAPSKELSRATTSAVIGELMLLDPDLAVSEGKSRMVTHMVRERNPQIVDAKKNEAIYHGRLFCEVCNFSFVSTYGCDFIECHHRVPIYQTGQRDTKLEDLALVCANCHRMLHRRFDGRYLTIRELQQRLPGGSVKQID